MNGRGDLLSHPCLLRCLAGQGSWRLIMPRVGVLRRRRSFFVANGLSARLLWRCLGSDVDDAALKGVDV